MFATFRRQWGAKLLNSLGRGREILILCCHWIVRFNFIVRFDLCLYLRYHRVVTP